MPQTVCSPTRPMKPATSASNVSNVGAVNAGRSRDRITVSENGRTGIGGGPPPQDYRTPRGFGKPPMPPSHAHAIAARFESPANTPEITKVEMILRVPYLTLAAVCSSAVPEKRPSFCAFKASAPAAAPSCFAGVMLSTTRRIFGQMVRECPIALQISSNATFSFSGYSPVLTACVWSPDPPLDLTDLAELPHPVAITTTRTATKAAARGRGPADARRCVA